MKEKQNQGKQPVNFYTVDGKTLSLQDWGIQLGIKWKTLWDRLNRGIPISVALAREFKATPRERNKDLILKKQCKNCGSPFVIPRSRDHREHCCSSECKASLRQSKSETLLLSRTRLCSHCEKPFVVKASQLKTVGHGKYCSQSCASYSGRNEKLSTPEALAKRSATFKARMQAGEIVVKSGESHPSWKGGIEASHKRRRESGKASESLRNYRQKNPDKVREFSLRRNSRKLGRLPRGTVKSIGNSQKWKCVVCRCDIRQHFHVDHITPLAKGGQHVPTNIQLLCQTCNVRKSAKDPIDFMQSRGYLL